MNGRGVASSSWVNSGESRPKPSASTPTRMPAVYWRSRSPEAVMIALTGPVRQVETAPTQADASEPRPHTAVMALIGGSWPVARSTAMPWPFCTTSTVTASGTTSSTMARQENAGA